MLIACRRSLLNHRAIVLTANNTALDGHNVGSWSSGATATISLSTSTANPFVGVVVTNNSGTVSGVSGSTIGALSLRAQTVSTNFQFWAVEASTGVPLASETITVTYSLNPTFGEIVAFGVSGVTSVGGGFDPSGATTTTTLSGTVTTSNPNDFLLSMFRDGGVGGHSSGWTPIADNTTTPASGFTLVQYKIVTATQSGLSVIDPGTSSTNASICDALVSS